MGAAEMWSAGQTLLDRYLIEKKLSFHVYLCCDLRTEQRLCVKALRLSQAQNWKQIELFEREARTLRYLKHAQIPELIDFQRRNQADDVHLFLVTRYIQAPSLAERLQQGWRCSIEEAQDLAEQVLKLLRYLHSHSPPLIHRDIKPANLLWDDAQRLYLVDFGGVHLRGGSQPGSTVMGTFGYMAPEQFSGQAEPASDLYALGATLVHLLSGQSPAEMNYRGLSLNYEPHLPPAGSRDFYRWLSRLLQPDPTLRFRSAQKALTQLRQPLISARLLQSLQREGIGCHYQEGHLEVSLPRRLKLTEQLKLQSPLWLSLGFSLSALCLYLDFKIQGYSLFWPLWSLRLGLGLSIVSAAYCYYQLKQNQFLWQLAFQAETLSLIRQTQNLHPTAPQKQALLSLSPQAQLQLNYSPQGDSFLQYQSPEHSQRFELGLQLPEHVQSQLNLLLEQGLEISRQKQIT